MKNLLSKFKDKKFKNRIIAISLIVALAGVFVFSANASYAKYITSVNIGGDNGSASIATPVVEYVRGKLVRNENKAEELYYTVTDKGTVYFDDVRPEDEIKYYFSINNNADDRFNEVKLKVTVSFSVYLSRLIEDSSDPNAEPIYFVVGKNYAVGEYPTMENASITFTQVDATGAVENDYIKNPDSDATISYNEDYLYISGEDDPDSKTMHSFGFYIEPGSTIDNRYYCMQIILPVQSEDEAYYTVAGKLYIDVLINVEQVLS